MVRTARQCMDHSIGLEKRIAMNVKETIHHRILSIHYSCCRFLSWRVNLSFRLSGVEVYRPETTNNNSSSW
jgi:hypothetical protein